MNSFQKVFKLTCIFLLGASAVFAQKAGKGLDINNLDKSASPAQDFYTYAVGSWAKNNPIPAEYSRWGSFEILTEHNYKGLKEILENAANDTKAKKGGVVQKVGDFYYSGMDSAKIEQAGMKPIQKYLDEIAKVKTKDDAAKATAKLQRMQVYPMFYYFTSQDAKNSSYYQAQLYQGGLSLPDRDYYINDDAGSKETREKYLAHVKKMFVLAGESEASAEKAAKTVLEFETKLAQSSWPRVELRDPVKTYNKMNLKQLSDSSKGFNWTVYFKALGLENPGDMNVGQPSFFKAVGELVSKTSVEDLKTYLKWNVISSSAPYLSSAFVNESFDFNGKYLNGSEQMQPRWKKVLQATDGSIGEALGQLYVEKYFPATAKERAQHIVANLLKAMGERINNVDWMSDATKKEALTKLSTFKVKIGYPDKWMDYSSVNITRDSYLDNVMKAAEFNFEDGLKKVGQPVDRLKWEMTPQTVNAYYNPVMNEIVFPAAILQPPFFNQEADDAINYGAMGAVIGHEITHGFDDQGRQFDAEGNIRVWWTDEDEKKFTERAKLIVGQYSGYEVLDSVFINGELTQGENIADLGGLTVSFTAFKNTDQYKNNEVIDGFTPAQRFFLSWAQVWRNNIREQLLRVRVKTDPHSPGMQRVLGPLSNMPEFYEAFGVKENDGMYRPDDKRVKIW
ncbi:MAG TPA: M13 family metallopeptidase [Ignavibacteriales bacterium]|nr:M13 family metallopeptidase [Ignavibacteriales bacterium]